MSEIKVSDCCALCELSEKRNEYFKNSVVLYCCLHDERVWSHEFCDDFVMEENALDLPTLEEIY
ncbi:hypothetical protein [Cetobacterium sp.]|uniref:hypothetical protein n=1 Tax=Cetobacterium sp. TaxID=2071632 RepID=UPI003F3F0FB3